jgi:hypothetical protein
MNAGTGKQGHEDVAFLSLRGVAKRYAGGTSAVCGVDLDIHRDEIPEKVRQTLELVGLPFDEYGG